MGLLDKITLFNVLIVVRILVFDFLVTLWREGQDSPFFLREFLDSPILTP
jgi:hypothetical protein